VFSQINLRLVPSTLVGATISVPILASVLLIASLALPAYISAIIIGLNLWILHYHLTLLSRLSRPGSIVRIQMSKQAITLHDASGNEIPARLREDSFISRWFCILQFEALLPSDLTPRRLSVFRFFQPKRHWNCILCNDNVSHRDHLRRLRVLINYGDISQSSTFSNP